MKDWTGNSRTTFSTLGASSHSDGERETNDFYATDPIAIPPLFERYPELLKKPIWEPACGQGHLSKPMVELGAQVESTDLIDRGYGISGRDFLLETQKRDCHIVTNPPYKLCLPFVLKALELTPDDGLVCFLLKLQYLEGLNEAHPEKCRRKQLYDTGFLKKVWVFSRRLRCAKNGDFSKAENGAVCFAWFVFSKQDCDKEPPIGWI